MPYVLVSAAAMLLATVFFVDTAGLLPAAYHLPRILCVVLFLLAMMVAVEALIARRRYPEGTPAPKGASLPLREPFFKGLNVPRTLTFVLSIIASAALLNVLGYFVVTPLFLLGTLLYLRACRWYTSLLISVLFPVFVYFVFVRFLDTPLPMGVYFD